MDEVKTLLDRQAISDILIRYATAIDSNDWPLLEKVFVADAVCDYGRVGVHTGLAAITELCRGVLEPLDSSQHVVTNHDIEVEGDTAKTRCYLVAQHTKAGTDGGPNYTVGGAYVDDFVRTPQGWRIKRRELKMLWDEGNAKVLGG